MFSSPAIGSDGTIYIGSSDSYLYAVNPDGSMRWKYKTGFYVLSSPVITADGTIYVGSHDKKLHAINPDGTPRWTFETQGFIASVPALASDGTIYFGSYDTYFYAVSSTGNLVWKKKLKDRIDTSAMITKDGTVYISDQTGTMYAFTGSSGWAIAPWGRFKGSNTGLGRALNQEESQALFDLEITPVTTTTTPQTVVSSNPVDTSVLATKAILVGGTIMLPVRELAALVGAQVTRFAAGTATIQRGLSIIDLTLGKSGAGYRAPILYNAKMYVPLRALNGLQGVSIAWGAASKSVLVNVEGKVTQIKLDLATLPNLKAK